MKYNPGKFRRYNSPQGEGLDLKLLGYQEYPDLVGAVVVEVTDVTDMVFQLKDGRFLRIDTNYAGDLVYYTEERKDV